MKVKALVKSIQKSNKNEIAEKYAGSNDMQSNGMIFVYIDGCFVPYSKAREDSRKVDSFYLTTHKVDLPFKDLSEIKINAVPEVQYSLNINTVYIKEKTSNAITKENTKKNKKKDKKNKKNKK